MVSAYVTEFKVDLNRKAMCQIRGITTPTPDTQTTTSAFKIAKMIRKVNILRNKTVGPKGTESHNVVSGASATFSGEQKKQPTSHSGTMPAEVPGTGLDNYLPILSDS